MQQYAAAKQQAQESGANIPFARPKYVEHHDLQGEFLAMALQYIPVALTTKVRQFSA